MKSGSALYEGRANKADRNMFASVIVTHTVSVQHLDILLWRLVGSLGEANTKDMYFISQTSQHFGEDQIV